MGRRFSNHGHLISRTSGSGKLSTVGVIPAACLTAPLPSASAFLPALRRARALHRRPFIYLLHRTIISTMSAAACFTEPPAFRAASEDAPFPPAALHKPPGSCASPSGSVSAGRLSASCFVSSLSTHVPRSLPLRSSLSTDSFAADRFNESCKIDASVVSCRFPARKPGPIRARRHEAGAQR
jgi:hypothetical protein